jgi:hypothetical protein
MTPILRFAALAGIRVKGVACADAATRDLARVGPYECPWEVSDRSQGKGFKNYGRGHAAHPYS